MAKAATYDLIVVENAVNNLAYPLCQLHQLRGVKLAYWGHGRHRGVKKPSPPKYLSEKLKIYLTRRADGFFAYTTGEKLELERRGLSPQKIFVLNNTIDINEQRQALDKWRSRRESTRQELGIQGKKVLLFVGRFTWNKRIDFLLKSFSILCEMDPSFHLILIGSGGEAHLSDRMDSISYLGSIVELDKLAPIYAASDVLAFPGSVGLGPLQALCYDLPVITIDSSIQMPEFGYLSPHNSIVLGARSAPEDFAEAIVELFHDPARLDALKTTIWPSIKHLTIERMALNFSQGVNAILGL